MKTYGLLVFLLCSMCQTSASRLDFAKQMILDPAGVGSITPSSSYTGKAITSYIRENNNVKSILEIGAGPDSGITREVIAALSDDDVFYIVEINPLFCKLLYEKYGHLHNVVIIEGDVLTIELNQKFDYIVSSLPLTVFSSGFIEKYYNKLLAMTKPGGMISYIEYIALRRLREMTLRGQARKKLNQKSHIIDSFHKKWCIRSDRVLRNMPPTWVHHLCIS